jgi:hypothetical protein
MPVCVHGILGFPRLAVVPRGLKLDLDVAFGTFYIDHRAIPNLRPRLRFILSTLLQMPIYVKAETH